MSVSDYLHQEFLRWEAAQGQRRTVTAFAEHLGVPQTSLSSWMNRGSTPGGKSLVRLAARLGPGIYDVMGLPKPAVDPVEEQLIAIIRRDPAVMEVLKTLATLPEALRAAGLEMLAEGITAMAKGVEPERISEAIQLDADEEIGDPDAVVEKIRAKIQKLHSE